MYTHEMFISGQNSKKKIKKFFLERKWGKVFPHSIIKKSIKKTI